MSECIVFNDASLPFPIGTAPGNYLKEFFDILKKANDAQISLNNANEAHGKWGALNYSPEFNFGDWLNNSVDHDERLRIKNIMSKVACPFHPEAKRIIEECIFVLEENESIEVNALGIASALSSPSLSFPSHTRWSKNYLTICEESEHDGTYNRRIVQIKNIFTLDQIRLHVDEVCGNRQASSNFLKSLVTDGNDDFPNLLFGKGFLKTVRKPIETSRYSDQIILVLNKLNVGILESNSLDTLSQNTGLEISGESVSTMNNDKFRKKRYFDHPNMGSVLFGIHVKNFTDARRMHIFPDFENGKICVGYFGRHLPTVSDPT